MGNHHFLIPLRGSQPAVRACRLPVPIASVWLPAERTQPGVFVCRLFIIAGLFLVFRQLPPVGVAVDLVLQLLPERLRGRRLLGVRGDGIGHIRAVGGVDSVCLRRGQVHTLGRRRLHLRSVRRHDGRRNMLQIRAVGQDDRDCLRVAVDHCRNAVDHERGNLRRVLDRCAGVVFKLRVNVDIARSDSTPKIDFAEKIEPYWASVRLPDEPEEPEEDDEDEEPEEESAPWTDFYEKTVPAGNGGRYYQFCKVQFKDGGIPYAYLTGGLPLAVGDFVVVPVGNRNAEKTGRVTDVFVCSAQDAPYPPEKAKFVLRKSERSAAPEKSET